MRQPTAWSENIPLPRIAEHSIIVECNWGHTLAETQTYLDAPTGTPRRS